MAKKASIPIYVKLVSADHLGLNDARLWYKIVLASAPTGIVTHIDSIDVHGRTYRTRVVRRSKRDSTELIIPLMRDLLPTELEKIANAWRRVSHRARIRLPPIQRNRRS